MVYKAITTWQPEKFKIETVDGVVDYKDWCKKECKRLNTRKWMHFVKKEDDRIAIFRARKVQR